MALKPSTNLRRTAFVSCLAALIFWIVAFACPNWVDGNFLVPLIKIPYNMNASVHMGVYTACKYVIVPRITLEPILIKDVCDTEGAKQWQKTAGYLSLVALVVTILTFFLSCGEIFIPSFTRNLKAKAVIMACGFLSMVFIMCPILLHAVGKNQFQVDEKIDYYVNFEYDYAIYLASLSVALYGLQVFFHFIDLVWNGDKYFQDRIDWK